MIQDLKEGLLEEFNRSRQGDQLGVKEPGKL
jgi:hypothetical protein